MIEGTELLARCIQHETDHLDGVLFIDRLDRAQRKLAMKAIREAEWAGGDAPTVQGQPARDLRPGAVARVRLVFAGTPAGRRCPSLEALLASRHEVVAVVTRPDAPSGRGRQLMPSARSATAAEAPGSRCSRPARSASPDFLARLRALAPDCCPVVAYGALVPPAALDIPRHGWVNLHFSLLPAWRGAAPVQHALLAGDEVTGATTFLLEEGLDTGPVFGVMTETVRPTRHRGDLLGPARRAAAPGCSCRPSTASRTATLRPGAAAGRRASRSRRSSRSRTPGSTGRRRRSRVDRLVRGCTPAPGAWTTFRGERLKLGPVRAVGAGDGEPAPAGPGRGRGQPAGGAGRHRRPARSCSARCSRRASGRWPPPTGPAARGSTPASGSTREPTGGARPAPARPAARRSGPRPRSAQAPAQRARSTDPARRAAFDLLRAVEERDAYANLVLPGLLRDAADRRPRRGVRHRARLRHAARAGHATTRSWPRCVDRPLAGSTRGLLDVLRLGAHQLLGDAGPGARRGRRDRRAGPRRRSATGPGGFVNAVLRRVGERDLAALGGRSWRRRRRRPGRPPGRRAEPPGLDRPGDARRRWPRTTAAAADSTGWTPSWPSCSPPTTSPPRSPWSPGPGWPTVDELLAVGRRARGRWSPYAVVLRRRRPGRAAGGARGPRRRAGRGQPARRAGARRGRRSTGRDRALARPVRRARAARPRCSRRSRPSAAPGWWPTSCSRAPGRAGPRRRSAGAGDAVEVRRRRRPRARRAASPAAFDRVLVDAPCTGLGALRRRPEARWRRQPGDVAALGRAAARAARRGARRGPARAAWSPTSPARRTSPRPARRRATCCAGATTSSSSTRGRCWPASCRRRESLTAPRRRARPSSSGRTGTAPTRCSSRCCAGAERRRRLG